MKPHLIKQSSVDRAKAHVLRVSGRTSVFTDAEMATAIGIWAKSLGFKPHQIRNYQDHVTSEVIRAWEGK